MNSDLLSAAAKIVPNQQILVNMVSRRVRQLSRGHRPLVECAPGVGLSDIALSEIANEKLTWESTLGQNDAAAEAKVVVFPGIIVDKKTKKEAA
jgi:DNA-directed RNA polymerase subunit omega